MPIPTKTEIQAFEARLDRALAERVTNRCNANAALRLASNMAEVAATTQPTGSGEGVLNDGINSFSAYLVSGTSGPEPALEALFGDLDFGFHYHHLRGLLYYSYNAPGSIDWRFAENRIELRFLDPSLPRQFFTVWNENVLGSQRIFDGFDVPDKLRELLKNQPEFELGEAHEAADKLLQAHADLKLSAYFSILDTNSEIDLGGYSYREIYAVYRILLMKALYHRHQAAANDHTGCVHVQADELRDMLAQETKIDAAKVEAMLQDLVFDSKAAEDRVDSTYFCSCGKEPRRVISSYDHATFRRPMAWSSSCALLPSAARTSSSLKSATHWPQLSSNESKQPLRRKASSVSRKSPYAQLILRYLTSTFS